MNDVYIGDGVYASFDGYQISLAVNHHENRVIALEPETFAALLRFSEAVAKAGAEGEAR